MVFDNISLCPSLIPLLVSHFSTLKSSLCLVGSPLDNIYDYDFYEVYLSPLNFKEFIFNLKLNDVLLDSLDDYYSIYSKIGGYPKVVSLYIKTLDISECQSLLKSLVFSDLLSKISISPWEDDWGVYLHNLSGLLFYLTSLDYSSDSDYLSFLDTLLKYNYLSYLDNTYYFNDLGLLNLLYQDYHSDLDSLYTNLGLLFNFILLNSSDKLSSISFNFSTKSYHLCLDNLLIDLKRVIQISDVYSL